MPRQNTCLIIADYGGTEPVSLFKIYGAGSLQGSDAAKALEAGINQSHIDDSYTELQFQIVSSSRSVSIRMVPGIWIQTATVPQDTGVDKAFNFGAPGWTSVVGDWNGDGKTEIGIYQNGAWYLDYDGSGNWSPRG